jgi:hypothetical protein
VAGGDPLQDGIREDAGAPLRAPERPVGEDPDAPVAAVLGDAVQEVVVAPGGELHLHRRDRHDLLRLPDLAHRHVREPDLRDEPLAAESRQGAHARGKGDTRVGGVELVEGQALDAQGAEARFAGGDEVPRPAVRDPASARASEPALRRHRDRRSFPRPAPERPRDQPLVVADLALVAAIDVRGVQEAHPRVERFVEEGDRPLVVAVGGGGEPHAAEGGRDEPRAPRDGRHGGLTDAHLPFPHRGFAPG